jgi:tetratricopeptide (TPR) repeat protein
MALLERAVAAAPDRFEPHFKLGNIYADLYRPADAAQAFAAALRLRPGDARTTLRLAHALNELGRAEEARALLVSCAPDEKSLAADVRYQLGLALAALGRDADAGAQWRAALDLAPHHRRACLRLCKALRESGRAAALLAACERLAVQGVGHAQLLLDWGRALAIAGEDEKARALLFDPARVTRQRLALPDGFNDALAGELLASAYQLDEFPEAEANRGSRRVHHLLSGRRPELARSLLAAIVKAVDARATSLDRPGGNAFDPWAAARPRAAHLHPWGLIQKGSDYEAWHTHRGGWLSGVYYVRIPRAVAEDQDGRGALEFGPPPYLTRTRPGFLETRRYVPEEGLLLLAPSHYHHRTIPSGLDEFRVSFAFDVVPDDVPGDSP